LAQQIKSLIVKADNVMYDFLDYNGNKETWNAHIAKFTQLIEEIKALEHEAKKHAKHKKAAATLNKIHVNLAKVLRDVQSTRSGSINTFTVIDLGLKLRPIFEEFDNELPASMTIKTKIMKHYGGLDYLKHLESRLRMS
jgi:hypothetical protein